MIAAESDLSQEQHLLKTACFLGPMSMSLGLETATSLFRLTQL